MNFTPKANAGRVVRGLLTIAAVGLIGWVHHVVSNPEPAVARQSATIQATFLPAIEVTGASHLQTYVPVSSWYRNKHWWKRNAPIVGGAGGGALIGGLAGGGTGALIGGAAGGAGGYLYKRYHHRHYYHHE